MSRLKDCRRGFTMIELLVVIAVFAVLIGLLLPAVQKVRESAARTKCQNNLRQIAFALQNFENQRGYLQGSIREANAPRQGWALFILPYIEQENLFKQFDFSKGWAEGTNNRDVVGSNINLFHCPSTANTSAKDGAPDDATWTEFAATSDYAAICGLDSRLAKSDLIDPVQDPRGILIQNARTKSADIKDGLSNTILLAESAGRPTVYRGRGVHGLYPENRVNGGGWCRPASDFELKGSSEDGSSFPGSCSLNCTNGEDLGPQYPHPVYGVRGTSEIFSFHVNGANVAFGDGSVRMLFSNISIRVLARLVTRNGGEAISDTY